MNFMAIVLFSVAAFSKQNCEQKSLKRNELFEVQQIYIQTHRQACSNDSISENTSSFNR